MWMPSIRHRLPVIGWRHVSCNGEQIMSSSLAASGTFDLAVVGAGIIGLSCARAAALQGLRVVVLDRDARSSGASVRILVFVWEAGQGRAIACARARRTCAIWEEVARQAGITITQRGLW